MRTRQHEHMAIEGGHECQHDEEHGDQAHNDGRVVRIDYEDDSTAGAEGPNPPDDERGPANRHDVVVSQSVENRDVAVNGNSQKTTHGRYHRDADHRVKNVVHLSDEMVLHHQLPVSEQVDDYGLPGVGDTHQHVGHGQAADEEIHGRVQVFVFHYGTNDQDVFQQTDDAKDEEHLSGDVELLACFRLGMGWGLGSVEEVRNRTRINMHGPEGKSGGL